MDARLDPRQQGGLRGPARSAPADRRASHDRRARRRRTFAFGTALRALVPFRKDRS